MDAVRLVFFSRSSPRRGRTIFFFCVCGVGRGLAVHLFRADALRGRTIFVRCVCGAGLGLTVNFFLCGRTAWTDDFFFRCVCGSGRGVTVNFLCGRTAKCKMNPSRKVSLQGFRFKNSAALGADLQCIFLLA